MSKAVRRAAKLSMVAFILAPAPTYSQMKIDLPHEVARKAAGSTYMDDLSVKDTALIYQSMCIKDDGLYVPGWTVPADLANNTYAASGLLLRVEVLPGKKLRGTLIDAAQAQGIAKGRPSEPKALGPHEYNSAVVNYVNQIFSGGLFGVGSCEDERRANPLRPLSLFSLESINGFVKLSELLASATATKGAK